MPLFAQQMDGFLPTAWSRLGRFAVVARLVTSSGAVEVKFVVAGGAEYLTKGSSTRFAGPAMFSTFQFADQRKSTYWVVMSRPEQLASSAALTASASSVRDMHWPERLGEGRRCRAPLSAELGLIVVSGWRGTVSPFNR